MQQFYLTKNNSEEDELIALLLKRQAELNSLLEVTQAINKNMAATVLFDMLQVILQMHMKVGKLRVLLRESASFFCVAKYGGTFENQVTLQKIAKLLGEFRITTRLSTHDDPLLNQYDYFIPVFHKNTSLAYVLIGDFNTTDQLRGNDLNFIQTVINIIVVALENKKLFRERIQRERLQQEIELASKVQNMLIPRNLPNDHVVEVAATYLPHSEIGGDYYDYQRLNEDEVLWCIADVSGKGIAAALLMSNLQASLRAWTSVESDLRKVIEKLNTIVLDTTNGDRFITLFLAKYNEKTRVLTYVNAGHNPPLLYDETGFQELKLGTTMIGVFEELPFINVGEVQLKKKSLLFNYTDGLLDLHGDGRIHLTEEHICAYIRQNSHLPVDELNKNMLKHFMKMKNSKGSSDDITLLSLRFL